MQKLRKLFAAIDPGWIRLEQSAKGTFAFLTAALFMALILWLYKPVDASAAIVYALLTGFISFMTVGDSFVSARKRTLLLALIPFAVAPVVAGMVGTNYFVDAILLLALMFFSYYLRRYGMRVTELALCTVFAFYFSLIFGATFATSIWFAVGGIVGVLSAYLWQFFIRPYNPEEYLRRSLRGFDHNVLMLVKDIRQQLAPSAEGNQEASSPEQIQETKAALARVQQSRQVIEQYLVAVTSLKNFPEGKITQLRLQLFNIEQGLQRLTTGSEKAIQQPGLLPPSILAVVNQLLAILSSWLERTRTAIENPQEAMTAEIAKLVIVQERLKDELKQLQDRTMAEALLPPLWQIATGTIQILRAVGNIRELIAQARKESENAPETATVARSTAPVLPPPSSDTPWWQRFHPTTKLGVQAVVATSVAMLISLIFGLDHPNWAFWTAFIVIAGSTGESLRKIVYRVVGTFCGALIGTILAIALPPHILVIILIAIFCLFLALYTRIINYAWMVFWITIFVALLYELKGETANVILITRPVNTLIGATIAVLTVWYVFPLHAGQRFHMGLALYIKNVEQYISTLVANWLGQETAMPLDDTKVHMEDSYEKLSQAFPALAFEYNPVSQARSPLTNQTTIVTSIHNEIAHLSEAIITTNGMITPANPTFVQGLQNSFLRHIHELQGLLAHKQAPLLRPAVAKSATAPKAQRDQKPQSFEVLSTSTETEHPSEWQQALISFGELNHSISMLGDELEAALPDHPATLLPHKPATAQEKPQSLS